MSGEAWLGIGLYAVECLFFGWCIWVVNPKHPERLERLRRAWAPVEDEQAQQNPRK